MTSRPASWRSVVSVAAAVVVAVFLMPIAAQAQGRVSKPKPSVAGYNKQGPGVNHGRRVFASGSVDLGYKYFRPRLSSGYGVPFQQWVGFDVNSITSSRSLGGYAGLRLATPVVNIRSGAMYMLSLDRSHLPIAKSYDRELSETRLGDTSATYWALLTEMTIRVPLFGGRLQSETEAIGLRGVPENRYVFVETISVVSEPSWLLRQRLRFTYPMREVPGLFVGGAAEAIVLPGRHAVAWRAGPLARWRMYRELGFRLSFLPVVSGPDSLGLIGAEFEFGLRWFWFGE